MPAAAAASRPKTQVLACGVCGQVHARGAPAPDTVQRCCRCDAVLEHNVSHSLAYTAAFSLAALILYVPANIFPILNLELYGRRSENTVWDGVKTFYDDNDYFMAAIVLLASICVPVLKIAGLFFLVLTTAVRTRRWKLFRTRLFTSIEGIGRWAMLDVFVLSIWVAVVKLDALGSVSPGSGLYPFVGVVILTLMATHSFDPQLIWHDPRDDATEEQAKGRPGDPVLREPLDGCREERSGDTADQRRRGGRLAEAS